MVPFISTWFILDIQISLFYNSQNWGVKMEIMSSNFGLKTGYTFGEGEVNTITGLVTIQGKTEGFVSIEQLSASSDKTVQKDVGNTIARGILGGVLLGPLGAIGGLVLGRNKVEGANEFIFKVSLTNDKFFIFSTSSVVTSFHSLTPHKTFQINAPIENVPNKEVKSNSSLAQLVESQGGVEKVVKKCIVEQLHHNLHYFEIHNEHFELNEDDVNNEMLIEEDLHGDSLDTHEIMTRLDEYLGCEFPYNEDEFPWSQDVSTYTVQMLIDYVNTFVYGTTKPQQTLKTEPHQTQKVSIVDELGKLAELRNSGVLTEEEFLGLKTKLLSS